MAPKLQVESIYETEVSFYACDLGSPGQLTSLLVQILFAKILIGCQGAASNDQVVEFAYSIKESRDRLGVCEVDCLSGDTICQGRFQRLEDWLYE